MLRLSAVLALAAATAVLGGLADALASGHAGRALAFGAGLVGLALLHPLVLAVEMLLAHRAALLGSASAAAQPHCFASVLPSPAAPTPDPVRSLRPWIRAWRAEVRVSLRAFAWRMPWRVRAEPDHLPHGARGQRGVLLVHGYLCNRALWNDWIARLRAQGVPVVAVNLEPVLGRIQDTVLAIEAGVQRLEACTGVAPLAVAHSMGGLALRCWWAAHGGDARLHHAVTLATPHRGTWLARFGQSPNARQMRPGSPWLQALAAAEPPGRAARCTCVVATCDNVVFPSPQAVWSGATVVSVEGAAHLDLIDRPQAWAALERMLAGPGAGG
jgi:triacylglycerol esterase/lipase EstA (alpha/beta hydrolase family)